MSTENIFTQKNRNKGGNIREKLDIEGPSTSFDNTNLLLLVDIITFLLVLAICIPALFFALSLNNKFNDGTICENCPVNNNTNCTECNNITNSTDFDNTIIVTVNNSNDNSLLGTTTLQWIINKNIYTFFLGYVSIPDTGIAQDVVFVDFPFNYPDPHPLNPSITAVPHSIFTDIIVCGDVAVILNGDFRAGTVMLFDLNGLFLGLTGWRIMIHPDKLLHFDVAAIPLNSQMAFGQALFSVAFNFTV